MRALLLLAVAAAMSVDCRPNHLQQNELDDMAASAQDEAQRDFLQKNSRAPPRNEDCASRMYGLPCPELYDSAIPLDGLGKPGSACVASDLYDGDCAREIDFSSYSDEKKKDWGKRCGTNWLCATTCEDDVASLCPQQWHYLGQGKCAAPDGYGGPCDEGLRSFDNWLPSMKKDFAKQCLVNWPCEQQCEQDWEQPCPDGWTEVYYGTGKVECEARNPSACGQDVYVAGTTAAAKAFADSCKVSWPCVDKCRPDLSRCPRGWTSTELEGGLCDPPANSPGPCQTAVDFSHMTDADKIAFTTITCAGAAIWPCAGERAASAPRRPALIDTGMSGPVGDAGELIDAAALK